MNNGPLFLFFSGFAAAVSVAMWLDYFRRIDVFEKEKIHHLLIPLVIGGCSPYLSLFIYDLFDKIGFSEDGTFFNDLLYSIFGIGLNEELSKLIAVLLVLRIFKKQINEPIDVLIYAGVTALGFSMIENYYYFNNHGIKIITSRTFYSALEHIINTSIVVYGIYRFKLFKKGWPVINSMVGFSVAIASHGLFDFFLLDSFMGYFTAFLSIIIYLIGINFWIQMLNNANNYSSFFEYDKIHYSYSIVSRLFLWYAITIVIAFINNVIVSDLKFSVITFFYSIISDGFLFFIVILRVSRFKIFKLKYFTVKPQLPFYITRNDDEDFIFPFLNLPIKIRGENFHEYLLTKYLNRPIKIFPVNVKKTFIGQPLDAVITEKYLLFDDVIVYVISIPAIEMKENTAFLLKPKTTGALLMDDEYPIEGLFLVDRHLNGLRTINFKKLKFLEWIYLKPL